MMRHIHLDCFSGVSGNMLLGALLDAGYPESDFREIIRLLDLGPVNIDIAVHTVKGFAACHVTVTTGHPHHHHHRHLADIKAIIARAAIQPEIAESAVRVFERLAVAEASVHGTTPESIHFHEVGAIDSIVDIVGVVAGFHHLAPSTISCSPLPMPEGWVSCDHGQIPLPAPAVCELLKGVPVYGDSLRQELVTPTGAALVRELAAEFGPMPAMILEKTAYGAGTMERTDGRPNLLRLQYGLSLDVTEAQQVDVLDTHIDDWNPELWPHVSQRIMDAGALDISLIPIQMKKGRPGFLLRTICDPVQTQKLQAILFSETGTIGIRCRREQRTTLKREAVTVQTPWGPLAAKQIHTPTGRAITPEYESCREMALKHNIPLNDVYAAVSRKPSS